MKRMHILGATLALTGLATAGVLVATNPSRGATTGASGAVRLAAPGELAMTRQDVVAAQHSASAQAAGGQAAAANAAARAAAAAGTARTVISGAAAAPAVSAPRASRSTVRTPIYTGDARGIARAMLPGFGWSAGEFPCLDSLWTRESGWRVGASNPSGAYGIPQALPGSKMAAYGSDWQTNPRTQITWGLHYIQGRYGSPCAAWSYFQSHGWY